MTGMTTSTDVDLLWEACGEQPEFERLGVLADAYSEIGELSWQEFLLWCLDKQIWPEYSPIFRGGEIRPYTFWWGDYVGEDRSIHCKLPIEFGSMHNELGHWHTIGSPFNWYKSVRDIFVVIYKKWLELRRKNEL